MKTKTIGLTELPNNKTLEKNEVLASVKREDGEKKHESYLEKSARSKKLSDEPGSDSEGGYDPGEGPGSGHNPEPPPSLRMDTEPCEPKEPSPFPGPEPEPPEQYSL